MIHLKKILLEQNLEDVESYYNAMTPEEKQNADNAVIEAQQEVLKEDESIGWLLTYVQVGVAVMTTVLAFRILKKIRMRLPKRGASPAPSANKISLWNKSKGFVSRYARWVNSEKTRQAGIKKSLLDPITRAKKKFSKSAPEYEYLGILEDAVSKALNNPAIMTQLETLLIKNASKDLYDAFIELRKIKPSQQYTIQQMGNLLPDTKRLLIQIKDTAGETFNKEWAQTMLLGQRGVYSKTATSRPYNYENVVRPAVQKMINDVYNVTSKAPGSIEKGIEQQKTKSNLILPGMPGYSSNIRTSGN